MKNAAVKILAAASLGLLINGTIVPANAQTTESATEKTAASDDKAAKKPQLPAHLRGWFALGAGVLAVVAVAVGTGHSMKHEKQAKQKSRANRGISNPTARS